MSEASRRRLPRAEVLLIVLSGLFTGLGHGFFHFGVSAFVKPVGESLQLSRGSVATGIAIGRLVTGLLTLAAGWVADRVGVRWPLLVGVALTSIGLAWAALSEGPIQLLLAWAGVTGLGVALAFSVVLDKAVLTAVSAERRGRALGWRFAAIGLGTALCTAAAGQLLRWTDWRTTCAVWSALMALCLPVLWRLLRKVPGHPDPTDAAVAPTASRPPLDRPVDPAAPALAPSTVAQRAIRLWRDPGYLALAAAAALQSGVQGGVVVHLVPLLTDVGLDAPTAAVVMGLFVLMGIPARWLAGAWSDGRTVRAVLALMAALLLIEALAIGCFVLRPDRVGALWMAILFGMVSGALMPLTMWILVRRFGTSRFGAAQGGILLAQVPLAVAWPAWIGLVVDRLASYLWPMQVSIALLVLAAAALAGPVVHGRVPR